MDDAGAEAEEVVEEEEVGKPGGAEFGGLMDIVNPRDSEAIEDSPLEVFILLKTAANDDNNEHTIDVDDDDDDDRAITVMTVMMIVTMVVMIYAC